MLKKGQCSNSPTNCSFAKDGTLLPYAGPSSVCPECGAPLAMVAAPDGGFTASTEAKPQFKAEPQYRPEAQYEEAYEKAPNQALEFAKMAAIFVIVAGGAYFGARYFFSDKPKTEEVAITNQIGQSDNFIVNEVNPSQLAKLNANVIVRANPTENSANIGELMAGASVDITGRALVNGVEWARIIVPNQASSIGYVPLNNLSAYNSGAPLVLEGGDILSDIGNMVAPPSPPPPPPVAPVIGPIEPIGETVYYVNSTRANIRSEAGAKAAKVAEALKGDTLVASAKQKVDGTTWYKIALPTGGTGWVSSSTLTHEKPVSPDTIAKEEAKKDVPPPAKIEEGGNVVISSSSVKLLSAAGAGDASGEAQKGMVVQVQEIEHRDGATWYHVTSKRLGLDGWVESKSVKLVE